MNNRLIIAFIVLLSADFLQINFAFAQKTTAGNLAVENDVLYNKNSFYYIDFSKYPMADASLPIGVFDSGTGGLTILNTLIQFDQNNNKTTKTGEDGLADFSAEKFIYLADQANMPYGNYSSENKTDLLIEHVIKDAQFLLSNKYYADQNANLPSLNKQKVKAIVIACNTATAYGKEYIESFIAKTGIDLKVIGVIDAGAKGTLEIFKPDEDGSIGVFATVGTIASKGYENSIIQLKQTLGYTGNLKVFNQGGYGLAEAVDEEPDFVSRTSASPRQSYRGPSFVNADYKIDKTLMSIYNFDFSQNKMLCDNRNIDDCQIIQINSSENYVRYHLVSLMEKLRKSRNAPPLKALVLGCTHYPYLLEDINKVLKELYNYQKHGTYIYRELMTDNIKLIDPAVNVAKELYSYLKDKKLFNSTGDLKKSEFYISVPNIDNKNVQIDSTGRFTYQYKYGRNAGDIQEYVKVVPFSKSNITYEVKERLRKSIPPTYQLIKQFNASDFK